MELKDWAQRILSADTLEEKLLNPEILTDRDPGAPLFWSEPSRPSHMGFKKHTRKNKLPSIHELDNPDHRAACLHRFAGHELLAVEIMAYALLAFPNAPKHFRRGVANTLREEQEHVRLYMNQMERFGITFGDLPLFKHFWSYIPYLQTPEEYLSVMSLTFEMANLDYAPLYGSIFKKVGDEQAAALMRKILQDEIAHVSFGWNWLKKLKKEEETPLETYLRSLPPSLPPKKAMVGSHYQKENREKVGLTKDWMEMFDRGGSVPPQFREVSSQPLP